MEERLSSPITRENKDAPDVFLIKRKMNEKLVWTCHICHEWMPERTPGRGYLEWHVCDKCMEEDNE